MIISGCRSDLADEDVFVYLHDYLVDNIVDDWNNLINTFNMNMTHFNVI